MSALSWTPAQDALIRARYKRGAVAKLAAELGRPIEQVYKRARRIGVFAGRRWTPDEIQTVRALWGEEPLGRIAKRVRHPPLAVYWMAQKMKLLAVPQGYEQISDAAKRTGYETAQIRMICAWAGVRIYKRTSRKQNVGHRFSHLDPFELDEAIQKWNATEPVEGAALRRGVNGHRLRAWLRMARRAGFSVPAEPTKKKAHWRVESELIDRVIAWRSGLESISAAAKRIGLKRGRLTRLIRIAAVTSIGTKPIFVAREDVDRIVRAA